MPPRRRLGIRRVCLLPGREPAMSASASTASRADGQTKPVSSSPVATLATPGSGACSRAPEPGPATPTPSARSSSASRCAGPWPSVTSTTRHRSDSQRPTSASTCVVSPRYEGAGSASIRKQRTLGRLALVGCQGLRRVGCVSCYG